MVRIVVNKILSCKIRTDPKWIIKFTVEETKATIFFTEIGWTIYSDIKSDVKLEFVIISI